VSQSRGIDLNSDVGEGFGAWPGGPDEELMPLLTSVNVACGFHAGDPSIMQHTCDLARTHNCAIGGQVSYPDLAGFGRRFMDMRPSDLSNAVIYQLGALDAIARLNAGHVEYVKPHGALYNAIVEHEGQAAAVVAAVCDFDVRIPMLGLPDSAVQRACDAKGLSFVAEGFADRAYTADGRLVPRTQSGALITDPAAAANQALRLAKSGIESICVHSDTPGAVAILAAVARALTEDGYDLRPFVQ
jgi:UPF0271 protein